MPNPLSVLAALPVVLGQAGDGTTTTTTPVEDLVDVTSPSEGCGENPSWLCEWVLDQTDSKTLAGWSDWLVTRPATIVLVIAVAWVANRLLRWLVGRFVHRTIGGERRRGRLRKLTERAPLVLRSDDEDLRREARAGTLVTVAQGLVTLLVAFVALIVILQVLGVNLAPLLAGAGILGVALGFGAQDMIKDFTSGTFIILEDQYGVGDVVDLGDATGTVEKVTLRVTRLRDINGVVWHVPNGEIVRVANKSQDWARALLDVDVAYDTDLDRARDVIRSTAEAMAADDEWREEILDAPEMWGVENFGADGITMRLVAKVRPASQWKVERELRRRLKAAFDAEGIEIPFPQRTLWVKREEGAPDPFGGTGPAPEEGSS